MDERPTAPILRPSRSWLRPTPFRVAIAAALAGSAIFIAVGFVNRTPEQIPILSAGLAVLGLTLAALAIACVVGLVRAGREGRDAQAFWAALAGGVAALAAAASLAAAIVLALVWGSARQ